MSLVLPIPASPAMKPICRRPLSTARNQALISARSPSPLLPERVFVVQLRPQADPPGELFVGRIEHIASGTVFRFASAAELTTFIARICDPRSQSPTTCGGSHDR